MAEWLNGWIAGSLTLWGLDHEYQDTRKPIYVTIA